MERRLFFKNLLGGAAAVAIAPKLFDQIVEQEYLPPFDGPPPSPEMVFNSDTGVWIFQNDILYAYGGVNGVSLEFHREVIEISSIYHTKPYRTYQPRHPEGTWNFEDLRMTNKPGFNLSDKVHIIFKKQDGMTIESDAILKYLRTNNALKNELTSSGAFTITGEAIIYG